MSVLKVQVKKRQHTLFVGVNFSKKCIVTFQQFRMQFQVNVCLFAFYMSVFVISG